jgi:hypothetical protein
VVLQLLGKLRWHGILALAASSTSGAGAGAARTSEREVTRIRVITRILAGAWNANDWVDRVMIEISLGWITKLYINHRSLSVGFIAWVASGEQPGLNCIRTLFFKGRQGSI